eukprot:403352576
MDTKHFLQSLQESLSQFHQQHDHTSKQRLSQNHIVPGGSQNSLITLEPVAPIIPFINVSNNLATQFSSIKPMMTDYNSLINDNGNFNRNNGNTNYQQQPPGYGSAMNNSNRNNSMLNNFSIINNNNNDRSNLSINFNQNSTLTNNPFSMFDNSAVKAQGAGNSKLNQDLDSLFAKQSHQLSVNKEEYSTMSNNYHEKLSSTLIPQVTDPRLQKQLELAQQMFNEEKEQERSQYCQMGTSNPKSMLSCQANENSQSQCSNINGGQRSKINAINIDLNRLQQKDEMESHLSQIQVMQNDTDQQELARKTALYQKMQYKEALESEILEDPRTANAYNEYAPITNVVLGTGFLINYDEVRAKYDKVINTSNNPAAGDLQCDCCLSRVSYTDNKLVYCELCYSAIHVKCHGRKLLYSSQGGTIPFDTFLCERCKYYVDNDFENYEQIKCKFCDELKGILIYIDRNQKKNVLVGWIHLACIFWHSSIKFSDESRMDVMQVQRNYQSRNKCCYCRNTAQSKKTMTCEFNCKKTFHVRCAIQRGLITDYEIMREKQANKMTGEPQVYCSKHTRLFRELSDNPDMQSFLTEFNSTIGSDEEERTENSNILSINPEEDTFEHFDKPEDFHRNEPNEQASVFQQLTHNDVTSFIMENEHQNKKLNKMQGFGNGGQNSVIEIGSSQRQSQTTRGRRGKKQAIHLNLDDPNPLSSFENFGTNQEPSIMSLLPMNEAPSYMNQYQAQQYLQSQKDTQYFQQQRKRGPKPRQIAGPNQLSDKLVAQRMDEVSYFEQIIEHQNQDRMEALEQYPDQTKYYFHREHRETKRRGRMSFKEKIQMMHDQQLDRSTCVNNEFSQMSVENPSSTYIANNAAPTDIMEVKQYMQVRPELRQDFGLRLRMNAGENIMYDVRPELQTLFKLKSPCSRRDVLTAFVGFCNDNDLVDLQCHHYNISRHPKLRAMLGVDVMESREIFKYLKGLVNPFSVEEREAQRKTLVEMKFRNQLAINNQNMSEDFSNNQGVIDDFSFRV